MKKAELIKKIDYLHTQRFEVQSEDSVLKNMFSELACANKLLDIDLTPYTIFDFHMDALRYRRYFDLVASNLTIPYIQHDRVAMPRAPSGCSVYRYKYMDGVLFVDFLFDSIHENGKMYMHALLMKNATQKKFATFVVDIVARAHADWIRRSLDQREKRYARIFDRVFLPSGMLESLLDDIKLFIDNRRLYLEDLQIPWKLGLLFEGPPGNGKTLLIRALHRYYGLSCVNMVERIGPSGSIDMGDVTVEGADEVTFSLDRVEALLFEQDVLAHPPKLFYLEDIEKRVSFQSEGGTDQPRLRLSDLLNAIDGVNQLDGVIFIATTNQIHQLDDALIRRPGRFERIYHFPDPDISEILRFLQFYRITIEGGDIKYVVERLQGYSMNFVEEFIRIVKLKAKSNTVPFELAKETLERIHDHYSYSEQTQPAGFTRTDNPFIERGADTVVMPPSRRR